MSSLWPAVAWAVLSAATLCQSSGATRMSDEDVMKALKLSTEYNKAARPPPDNGTANTVDFFVHITSMVKVDSAAQQITLQLWLTKKWLDSRLIWLGKFNSSFDSVSSIFLPDASLWQPDITFSNVLEVKDVALEKAPLLVKNSGHVMYNGEQVVTFKCQLQMAHFPFDEQQCSARVSSRTQDTEYLKKRMRSYSPNASVSDHLLFNNEFCIVSAALQNHPEYTKGTDKLVIVFQRKSTFYMANLFLPSILLLAISTLTFCLPPECGERVSFSITIVLSMCVFLQLAGNYTPTQSESVPLITWHFTVSVLLTMSTVLCNAFVLNCHYKQHSGTLVSNWLVRALFLNRIVSGGNCQKKEAAADDASSPQSQLPDRGDQSSSDLHDNEWATVVMSADKVFFAVFFAFTLSNLIGIVILHAKSVSAVCLGTSG